MIMFAYTFRDVGACIYCKVFGNSAAPYNFTVSFTVYTEGDGALPRIAFYTTRNGYKRGVVL